VVGSTSTRISSLLLMSILGLVAVILIAPGVDLPDIVFQRNSSPSAICALGHQIPQGQMAEIQSRTLQSEFRDPVVALNRRLVTTAFAIPSIAPPILRC
jgi:hypothetical protein